MRPSLSSGGLIASQPAGLVCVGSRNVLVGRASPGTQLSAAAERERSDRGQRRHHREHRGPRLDHQGSADLLVQGSEDLVAEPSMRSVMA
jgi:hypothetical protein